MSALSLSLLPALALLRSVLNALVRRVRPRAPRGAHDAGMSTAEYAVGTIAAAGLAALLYQVLTSGTVSSALQGLVERAFSAPL